MHVHTHGKRFSSFERQVGTEVEELVEVSHEPLHTGK